MDMFLGLSKAFDMIVYSYTNVTTLVWEEVYLNGSSLSFSFFLNSDKLHGWTGNVCRKHKCIK